MLKLMFCSDCNAYHLMVPAALAEQTGWFSGKIVYIDLRRLSLLMCNTMVLGIVSCNSRVEAEIVILD